MAIIPFAPFLRPSYTLCSDRIVYTLRVLMRIFLTGSRGKIGSVVAEFCRREGHEVDGDNILDPADR